MATYRSSHADGIRLAVGIFAAILALAECAAVIVLMNRPALVTALGLPTSGEMWATIGAAVAMVVIIVSVLIGVVPRRGRY